MAPIFILGLIAKLAGASGDPFNMSAHSTYNRTEAQIWGGLILWSVTLPVAFLYGVSLIRAALRNALSRRQFARLIAYALVCTVAVTTYALKEVALDVNAMLDERIGAVVIAVLCAAGHGIVGAWLRTKRAV